MAALLDNQPADRPRVLVVDDEQAIREMLAEFLDLEGYRVSTAPDGRAALDALDVARFDLVLTDMKMPRMGGISLLEQLHERAPTTVAVLMTGFGTIETAIDAMKRGAYDYVLKPFKLDEVLQVVERAIEKRRLEADNIRLRQALSLYKVSEAISISLSADQVMDTVVSSCLAELRADLVAVWLDAGEGALRERACRRSDRSDLSGDVGALDAPAVAAHLRAREPLLVHGQAARRFFTPGSALPASLVAVALTVGNETLGFIACARTSPAEPFEEGQRKLLSIIGSRAAAAVENARLYGDLQATFEQTIEGLASAIDKMDRYTAGHSQRVARYAVHLARRLGLPEPDIEVVRQSALMHDIGKIGCVLNLNKPGRLTDDEYEAFKRHPAYGRDILSPIAFLHPLIPGVHLHHERFDGRGYPLGLKGQDIPVLARIISVADTYDAMTSDRSYRRALPHEVAVSEINRCSGTQFDPEFAANFLEGIEEHRQQARARGENVPE